MRYKYLSRFNPPNTDVGQEGTVPNKDDFYNPLEQESVNLYPNTQYKDVTSTWDIETPVESETPTVSDTISNENNTLSITGDKVADKDTERKDWNGDIPYYTQAIKDRYINHEGYRSNIYRDSLGYPTIGIGHLITDEERKTGKIYGYDWRGGLSQDIAEKIWERDFATANNTARKILSKHGINLDSLPEQHQDAFTEMAFQLGYNMDQFGQTFKRYQNGDLGGIIQASKSWKWNQQTPRRVKNFIKLLST